MAVAAAALAPTDDEPPSATAVDMLQFSVLYNVGITLAASDCEYLAFAVVLLLPTAPFPWANNDGPRARRPLTSNLTHSTGVSEISSQKFFSYGGTPNNPYIFRKLTTKQSDSEWFGGLKTSRADFICSFLKEPCLGVDSVCPKHIPSFAKISKKREKKPTSPENSDKNCFKNQKQLATRNLLHFLSIQEA